MEHKVVISIAYKTPWEISFRRNSFCKKLLIAKKILFGDGKIVVSDNLMSDIESFFKEREINEAAKDANALAIIAALERGEKIDYKVEVSAYTFNQTNYFVSLI